MEKGSDVSIAGVERWTASYYALCNNNNPHCIEHWMQLGTSINYQGPINTSITVVSTDMMCVCVCDFWVVSDILSVTSLCLLHALTFNATLFNICAICSNIPELGSWKDNIPWNGICFSDYRQVLFYDGLIFEKTTWKSKQCKSKTKFPFETVFLGLRELKLILCTAEPLVGIQTGRVYTYCIYSIFTFLYSSYTFL